MRLDELPKSARIEDRRGDTVARDGGVGIGTIVVLGLIGWGFGRRSAPPYRGHRDDVEKRRDAAVHGL